MRPNPADLAISPSLSRRFNVTPPGNLKMATLVLFVSLISSGCTGTKMIQPDVSSGEIGSTASATPQNVTSSADLNVPAVADPAPTDAEGVIVAGTGAQVAPIAPRPAVKVYGEAVSLNFEEAPLSDVVHSILGDTLGLDYIVEHPIEGDVTIRTRSPVHRDELIPILESMLLSNGVAMIRGPEDRFFIGAAGVARTVAPRYDSADAVSAGYSNIVIPLNYVSAREMADILAPVAPPDAFVRVDSARNLLVLGGSQFQLEGWLDIVATFDVDQLAGVSVGVFPVNRGSVEDMAEELDVIIGAAEGEDSGIRDFVSILPVERLNSILVVSPRLSYIETVGRWVSELDLLSQNGAESTLHVYKVMNGSAEQLASLLSQIFGSGAVTTSTSMAQRSQVAPGMSQARTGGGSETMPQRSGSGAGTGAGGSAFELKENVRIVSDSLNNLLLVYASPYEYAEVEKVLSKLDMVATQVLIEASIIEVTLVDDLQYGLEWTFQNAIGNNYSGGGALNLNGGDIGPLVPGFSYTVTNKAGIVKAAVNALAEKSLVNVISTPSILVLDNHTAAISVGDQQPIQSRQSLTEGGVSQVSIEYKDTGVKLEVTPSVNDGGLVTMDIVQSVIDVGPVDTATGQRSFLNRDISSRVAIRDGESVVLGGLIRNNETTGKTGVPLLMDIPVLGALFSSTTNSEARTELLVFITPRVMESQTDLRELNQEMRERMRGLKDFNDLPGFSQSQKMSD